MNFYKIRKSNVHNLDFLILNPNTLRYKTCGFLVHAIYKHNTDKEFKILLENWSKTKCKQMDINLHNIYKHKTELSFDLLSINNTYNFVEYLKNFNKVHVINFNKNFRMVDPNGWDN